MKPLKSCHIFVTIALIATSKPVFPQSYGAAYQSYLDQDYKASRKQLENMGDVLPPEGEYLLGSEYIVGQGGRHKEDKGISLIQDAAQKGFVPAMAYLGNTYYSGDHRFSSEDQAHKYVEDAAAAGEQSARTLLERLTTKRILPETAINEPTAAVIALPRSDDTKSTAALNQSDSSKPINLLPPAALEAIPPSPSASSLNVAPDMKSADNAIENKILLGIGAAILILLLYLFYGVRCPRCRKRRVSTLLDQEQIGQSNKTRMRNVTSETEHKRRNKHGQLIPGGKSRTNSKIAEHYTVRHFINSYKCRNCGNEFQTKTSKEG
jgi:TPR repeat protein